MNLYRAIYSNDAYCFGDSITEEEYESLDNKDQFEFWFNTNDD